MAPAEAFGRKRQAEEMDLGERKYGLDMDILECPICSEPFSPRVFQCKNGHTVCSSCHVKIHQCPSCLPPVDAFIRNVLAEKIVQFLEVSCPYAQHGCKQRLRFTDAEAHRKTLCAYRPCPCPVSGCIHEVTKRTLPGLHLQEEHQVQTHAFQERGRRLPLQSEVKLEMVPSEQFVMLRGINQKVQLLLHREVIEGLGSILFCSCFEDHSMTYSLKVPGMSADSTNEMDMNYLMFGCFSK